MFKLKYNLILLFFSFLFLTSGCDPEEEDGLLPELSVNVAINDGDFENVIAYGSPENTSIEVHKGAKVLLLVGGQDRGGVKRINITAINGFIATEAGDETGPILFKTSVADEDAKTTLLTGGYVKPVSESTTEVYF